MNIKNFEFKARVSEPEFYENLLLALNPEFKGEDHQIDTYFAVSRGRLKLREGNIENALIQYERENVSEAKLSKVILYRHDPDPALKEILINQLGVRAIVDKRRKIYFIGNVKFHFDNVENLGTFLEVEAIDTDNRFTQNELKAQCDYFLNYFSLNSSNLLSESYCEMILEL
jgi:predicted adenylyl cyclase CyaB